MSTTGPSRPRPGRSPGSPPNREAILVAARQEFATRGYAAATIRAIATGAGVDAALVHHYFGSKADLFRAAHQLPFDPREVLPTILAGDRDQLGVRLVRFFLANLTADPATGASPILGLLRGAVTHEDAARTLREYVTEEVLGPLAERLEVPDPQLRAGLVGSQMIGLAVARQIVAIGPLVDADDDLLVAWYAPTLQRYLTAPRP